MRKALKDSPTKRKLIQVAQDLMLTKGYEATSIEEICQKAKSAKGSFFHYFKNKEDLGKALVNNFSRGNAELMCDCMSEAGDDPLGRIYAMIDMVMKGIDDPSMKGCLVGTFVQEVSHTHPQIRNECCKQFQASTSFFEKDFREAKARYAPKAGFKPKELAEMLLAVFQGSFILMKAQQNTKAVKSNLRHFKGYLKTLYGR